MFKKISVLGRFIFLLLFLFTNVATVMPQGQGGERVETFSLGDLTALGEIVLQGRRASTVVFAPLPEDWNVKRMTVLLTFAYSSIMKNTSPSP